MPSSDQPACAWLCGAPAGPGTPFAWPILFALDSLRVAVFVLGFANIAAALYGVTRTDSRGQKVRFLALALLLLSVFGTELEEIGNFAHWRLPVNVAAVMLSSWGMWLHFRHELPARDDGE